MAGNYDGLIGQGQNAVAQRAHDFLEGSPGQIGASDASREQRVAGDQQFLRGKIEADAAFGVSGSMENVRRQIACPQRFAISNTRFDCDFARRGDADPRCLYVEHLQQRVVILIEQDWRASLRAQLHGSADVVDVGVGYDDLLHVKLVLADDGKNVFNVIARIDDHGFARGLVADDRAVTLQRADGQDLVDHSLIFAQAETIHHAGSQEAGLRPTDGAKHHHHTSAGNPDPLRCRRDLTRRLIRAKA